MQHLGVDFPADEPLSVVVWHALIERYIESSGFDAWAHLHPTFFMEVTTQLHLSTHPPTYSHPPCM